MDKQFTTLTSSYHDNYLQYKLTGNASYQNSYMSAEQGIQSILSSLQDQVTTQNQQMSSFYNSDVEGKIRETQSQIRSTQRNMIKESDASVAASMRNTPTAALPSIPQSYYISIGVLTGAAFLLSVL
jgi:peptidoglycan hydrolase CwlO-like protein